MHTSTIPDILCAYKEIQSDGSHGSSLDDSPNSGACFTKHLKPKIFMSIQDCMELKKILVLRCLVKWAPGFKENT